MSPLLVEMKEKVIIDANLRTILKAGEEANALLDRSSKGRVLCEVC